MPFAVTALAAVLGAVVTAALALLVRATGGLPRPEVVAERVGLRALLRRRLDPLQVTGLALAVASLVILLAVAAFGLTAVLAGRSRLWVVDAGAARWGSEHATPASTGALTAVTLLGDTTVVTVLAAATVALETARHGLRSRWPDSGLFMVAVVAGQNVLANGLKLLFARPRPPGVFPPSASALVEAPGFAFPSGHAAAAAATFAAAALLLGRGRSWPVRVVLAAAAAGLATAVSATRVLLGVHWVSDVIGGAALGGLWFLVCALAFGGRRLKLAAPLERVAARSATGTAGTRREQP